MTQIEVWWQAYKAALAGGHYNQACYIACVAVEDYAKAKARLNKEFA